MASQIISDGFFPTHIPAPIPTHIKLTGHAATRLKLLNDTGAQQLVGLSSAELGERSAAIEAEINKLATILRVFVAGLLLLDLVIVLAT